MDTAEKTPLRIVQLVEQLDLGGLERIAIDLAIAHRNAGYRSLIYAAFDAGVLAPEAEAAGIPVIPFRKPPGFSPRFVLSMAARLIRDQAQIIHTHNLGIHLYGALAARLAGVPAVVNTRHGPATSTGQPYYEPHFRLAMPFTDSVVFVSNDCKRILERHRHIPPRKSHVIINGIQTDRFLGCPSAPGSMRPRIRFGAVGRMMPVKGHSILLLAFAELVKRLPDAELRIVGGGALFEELTAQVLALGLAGRASIEGPNSRIQEFFAEIDILVFPSLSEGLPLVILEAMAAGLPIVSTRVGGVPEVAPEGEVAWFCPAGNAKSLAEVMYQAAVSPRLAEMGARAREIAAAHYDVHTMQQQYETIYRRILDL